MSVIKQLTRVEFLPKTIIRMMAGKLFNYAQQYFFKKFRTILKWQACNADCLVIW